MERGSGSSAPCWRLSIVQGEYPLGVELRAPLGTVLQDQGQVAGEVLRLRG